MIEEDGLPQVRLSKNTLITLGAAIAMFVPLITGIMWAKDKIDTAATNANAKLDAIDRRLERIEVSNSNVMSKGAFKRKGAMHTRQRSSATRWAIRSRIRRVHPSTC